MIALSEKDRRTVAAGASFIALALLVGRGAPAVATWNAQQRAAAKETVHEAQRLESAVRFHESIKRTLDGARQRLATYDTALIVAASQAVAGAELARILSDASEASEVHLTSVQIHGDTVAPRAHGLVSTGARASVRGDLFSIALFLQILEEGPSLVMVREFAITEADPAVLPGQRESLRLDVLVEGVTRIAIAPQGTDR